MMNGLVFVFQGRLYLRMVEKVGSDVGKIHQACFDQHGPFPLHLDLGEEDGSMLSHFVQPWACSLQH